MHTHTLDYRQGLPLNLNEALGTIKQPLTSQYPANTVSACMIVRDEQDNITAAINSFLQFADQIVIIDTGSVDDTANIIESHKDAKIILHKIKWPENFSIARNVSLQYATSRWCVWLDADDRIKPEDAEKIIYLKQAPLDRIFGFNLKCTHKNNNLMTECKQVRMFPNHPGIKFARAIHEQIIFSCARLGLHVVYPPVDIYHIGYEDKAALEAKTRRNIKLYGNQPNWQDDLSLTMCKGDAHFILGEWQEGLKCYQMIVGNSQLKDINIDMYKSMPVKIGEGYRHLGDTNKAIMWINKALAIDHQNIFAHTILGDVYYKLKQYPKSLQSYLNALTIPKNVNSMPSKHDMCRAVSLHYIINIYANILHDNSAAKVYQTIYNNEFAGLVIKN